MKLFLQVGHGILNVPVSRNISNNLMGIYLSPLKVLPCC